MRCRQCQHTLKMVTDLIKELRPDIHFLAASLAWEACTANPDLPTIEELHPEARWRAIREAAAPDAKRITRAVHARMLRESQFRRGTA